MALPIKAEYSLLCIVAVHHDGVESNLLFLELTIQFLAAVFILVTAHDCSLVEPDCMLTSSFTLFMRASSSLHKAIVLQTLCCDPHEQFTYVENTILFLLFIVEN